MKQKNLIAKYKEMRKNTWSGIWAKRILSQMNYLLELLDDMSEDQSSLLEKSVEELWDYVQQNGAVSKEIVEKLEMELMPLASLAKSLEVLLIAHAHIDMNWMWGFQETASVTVDTFETMLQLMEEYPQFTFSQSQASVYRIIEKYYPELLERIRKRVQEGRWEITASSWVENDKNMSGSEAMARHLLYTRKYLANLMDISPDSLQIDFEPDTFGHTENLPEILNQGGVKYYYHCRGYDKEHVYRWQAPSGAEVLVYREPVWYNDEVVEYDSLGYIPGFCRKYGLKTAMKLYGVGDHGGGPTRRDISRWIEMQSWPLMPSIRFGTVREFFAGLEKVKDKLPVVKGELNYIFTGCYTSQARIKRANKLGEDRLYESEAVDAAAKLMVPEYRPGSEFQYAWEKILFNQFHDILPGSGVAETRDYAMGEFQKAMAASQINLNHAMRSLCKAMDTSAFDTEEDESRSFGAGAGFGLEDGCGYMTGYAGRSAGNERIITVFNPTCQTRQEVVKAVLWDWNADGGELYAKDEHGNEVACQIKEEGTHFWGHHYHTILLAAEVDPLGYRSYVVGRRPEERINKEWAAFSTSPAEDPRVDRFTDMPLVMENDMVRAVFSPDTMKLISFTDKETGEEKLLEPACCFRLITENTVRQMTAWRVGTYMKNVDLNQEGPVRLLDWKQEKLYQQAVYQIPFGRSDIKVAVSLAAGSRVLEFEVHVRWHELGNDREGIPQLNFAVPLGYQTTGYLCSVPFGIKKREELAQDVPCTGFMAGEAKDGKNIITVMSDCKYGFRGYRDSISLALLRSSFDPDSAPDQGEHHFRIGVGIVSGEAEALAQEQERFVHPLYACANSAHPGILPASDSLLSVEGGAQVSAVKISEDGKGLILRLYSLKGQTSTAIIKLQRKVCEAAFTDVLEKERRELSVEGNTIRLQLPAYAVRTVYIK